MSANKNTDPMLSLGLAQFAGMVGVPGILFQLYGPQIQNFLAEYPDLMKLLAGGAGLASLHHLATKSLPQWLPTAKMKESDPLFKNVLKIIGSSEILRKLELAAHSTEYRRERASISWPDHHQGSKDVFYEKSGTRIFFYHGTLFILQAEPKALDGQLDEHGPPSSQDITLKALSFQYAPIKALLQEAWNFQTGDSAGKRTTVRHVQHYPWGPKWDSMSKASRPLDTVDIDEDSKSRLIADIANYLDDDTKVWYARRGIPYRRGYMFSGPPGTGKSSLAMAIAGRFDLTLNQISLSDPRMSDSNLMQVLGNLPPRCVLQLEDIDSAGLTREVATTSGAKLENISGDSIRPRAHGVTLSGLLNALDGAAAPEGHILIMSTNALDALDPALVRAGRVDYTVEFKNASQPMAENIFKRMMAGPESEEAELCIKSAMFAGQIPEGVLAPAAVQGYLLNYKGDPDGAVSGVRKWVADFLEDKAKKAAAKSVSDTTTVNAKSSRKRKQDSTVERSDRVLRPRKG